MVYIGVGVFFKQKTSYEIMSGDWSSDVCSSDLRCPGPISVFCLFLVSEKLYMKYSRIALIIYEGFLFTGKETESKGELWVGPTATRRP